MFNQHYQYLVLLSGPLASLQATVPKMTPMDGELCFVTPQDIVCCHDDALLSLAPEEDSSASEKWEELMVSHSFSGFIRSLLN